MLISELIRMSRLVYNLPVHVDMEYLVHPTGAGPPHYIIAGTAHEQQLVGTPGSGGDQGRTQQLTAAHTESTTGVCTEELLRQDMSRSHLIQLLGVPQTISMHRPLFKLTLCPVKQPPSRPSTSSASAAGGSSSSEVNFQPTGLGYGEVRSNHLLLVLLPAEAAGALGAPEDEHEHRRHQDSLWPAGSTWLVDTRCRVHSLMGCVPVVTPCRSHCRLTSWGASAAR
jgi:hypothetical protein